MNHFAADWPRLILESVRDFAILTLDVDRRVTSWNAGAVEILGYTEAEILGRSGDILFVPEDRARGDPMREMGTAAREGKAENERWHLRKDGGRFYGSGMTHAMRDADGQLLGFVKVMRDLTERIRARDALNASEARLRALAEAGSKVLYRMNADWSEMYELSGGGFIMDTKQGNRDWVADYIPAEEQTRVHAAVNEAIRTKQPFRLEHRVKKVEGGIGWASSKAVPIFDAHGEILEWFGAANDITARKQLEAERDTERRRLAAVFEAIPVGLGVIDGEGRLVLANREMYRYMPTGLAPSHDDERAHLWRGRYEDGRPLERRDFPGARALRGEKVVPGIEMTYLHDDGREMWTQVAALPLVEPDGGVTGSIAVVIDIDAQKRAEVQLREDDRRKSEFLAMLGHELRNPLMAVDSGIKLLRSSRARPDSQQKVLPVVAQQVGHMKRLVDDVLDLARLERGRLQVDRVEVELQPILQAAVDMVESVARGKQAELRLRCPPRAVRLQADSDRLLQVIVNLLSNALKFSPWASPVEITLRTEEGWAVISVRDYGRGIPRELLTTIFEPFVQSQLTLGASEGGLGLGLSVARELVELHGGSIHALSEGVGQGSDFVVRLPLPSPS